MQFGRFILTTFLAASSVGTSLAATHARRGPTSQKQFSKHAAKPKLLGQRSIDDERAAQIQAALIKYGYLTGQPSGHWDASTEAAMGKLQADNGWQTKLVPDSRALIKLGLGPNNETVATGAATASSNAASLAASR
jgi:peptidoglycan hydrolase-like protein with peptidoglycan-binding domain